MRNCIRTPHCTRDQAGPGYHFMAAAVFFRERGRLISACAAARASLCAALLFGGGRSQFHRNAMYVCESGAGGLVFFLFMYAVQRARHDADFRCFSARARAFCVDFPRPFLRS